MDRSSLIFKVLSGEASEKEQSKLERWVAGNPGNKSVYDAHKVLWQNATAPVRESEDRSFAGLWMIKSRIELKRKLNRKIRLVQALCVVALTVFLTIYLVATTDPGNHPLLRFDNAPLEEVIPALEKQFHVVIDTDTKVILGCRFTGTFYKTVDKQDLIRLLSSVMHLKCEMVRQNRYLLSGVGCAGDQSQ